MISRTALNPSAFAICCLTTLLVAVCMRLHAILLVLGVGTVSIALLCIKCMLTIIFSIILITFVAGTAGTILCAVVAATVGLLFGIWCWRGEDAVYSVCYTPSLSSYGIQYP